MNRFVDGFVEFRYFLHLKNEAKFPFFFFVKILQYAHSSMKDISFEKKCFKKYIVNHAFRVLVF